MFWKKKKESVHSQQEKSPFLIAWRDDNSGMVVNIDPGQIESPATAGIMLADIYRHFAPALTQSKKALSEDHARAEMIALFLTEIQGPTDEGSGTIKRN